MSEAVDLLLSRLDDPRPNGKDRWRAACPACGGRNRSTLSVGVGDAGAVLVRCWKSGCSVDEIAGALGLQVDDFFPPRDSFAKPMRRRRLLTARQALELLEDEATLLFVCAADLSRGVALPDQTRQRLTQAAARIALLREEIND